MIFCDKNETIIMGDGLQLMCELSQIQERIIRSMRSEFSDEQIIGYLRGTTEAAIEVSKMDDDSLIHMKKVFKKTDDNDIQMDEYIKEILGRMDEE